jgi:hypothetical protein
MVLPDPNFIPPKEQEEIIKPKVDQNAGIITLNLLDLIEMKVSGRESVCCKNWMLAKKITSIWRSLSFY